MIRATTDPNQAGLSLLASIELFKGLHPATLQGILHQAQRRRLEARQLLFNVGDASGGLYVISNGRMRIWSVSAAGAEVTLNVLTKGTVFGEIGMLDASVRTAGASAMDATELLEIGRRTFFNALDCDPQLARNIIELLCLRLRWVSARLEDATLRAAPQRLARMLGYLARDHGNTVGSDIAISIRLTQGELAQWAAMSRESLNKLMVRWAEEGIITQSRGQTTVHQLDRLDEIAEFGE
jgi:CRP/FNR family transcriptional regulator, cyclic AMP receptor protein